MRAIKQPWTIYDPSLDVPYTYSIDVKKENYQILVYLENEPLVSYNDLIINQAQAKGYVDMFPQSYGDPVWIFIDSNNTPVQDIQELQNSWNLDITDTSDTYKISLEESWLTEWTGENLILQLSEERKNEKK